MTVSGILSGLVNPLGVGYALSQAAVRIEPIRPTVTPPAEARACVRRPAGGPLFDTLDMVELSPAARSDGVSRPNGQPHLLVPTGGHATSHAVDIYA